MRSAVILAVFVVGGVIPATALAQRFSFEKTFDVTEPFVLDVVTERGSIEVVPGEPGHVVVTGAATVRVGWRVPVNAADLARGVAQHPPIEVSEAVARLRPPSEAAERDAVTVNYQVRVPPHTEIRTASDSGATTVGGVSGRVIVRTQSAAIELARLGGAAEVTTGSGTVVVDDVAGALSVTTGSSAFMGRSLRGNVHVSTSSGSVETLLAGGGDVDIETGSSAIRVAQAKGSVTAVTRSGHVSLQGEPVGNWNATTGSGSIDVQVDSRSPFRLEAASGSGSVKVEGASVQGTVSKRSVSGTVRGGGSLIRATTRSGSIAVTASEHDAAALPFR